MQVPDMDLTGVDKPALLPPPCFCGVSTDESGEEQMRVWAELSWVVMAGEK